MILCESCQHEPAVHTAVQTNQYPGALAALCDECAKQFLPVEEPVAGS